MCDPKLIETHASVLVFLGDRVYKVKKPVLLPFLDLRSEEARRAVLTSELDLNRRMSPDIYLALSELNGPNDQSEPVLIMRRLPEDRRLSALVTSGVPVESDLRALAHSLARFHATCEAVAPESPVGTVGHLRSLWMDAFDVFARHHDLPGDAVAEMQDLVDQYLAGRSSLFRARRRNGRVHDGHGDLLADDIFLLPDGPRVLDCLEFDPSLRYGDGLLDAAFLAMDLERCGEPRLAELFLREYEQAMHEDAPASLVHHLVAYRAAVRAKVALLRQEQGNRASLDEASRLIAQALRHLRTGGVRLVVISGLPGTGKSTLAEALQRKWHGTRSSTLLQSDVIRDECVPCYQSPEQELGGGRYRPQAREAVYQTMFVRAKRDLRRGKDVILDASFADADMQRGAEALAGSCHARLLAFRCEAAEQVVRRRLADRVLGASSASEADQAVHEYLAASQVPWQAAHRLNTARDVDGALMDLLKMIY